MLTQSGLPPLLQGQDWVRANYLYRSRRSQISECPVQDTAAPGKRVTCRQGVTHVEWNSPDIQTAGAGGAMVYFYNADC